MTARNMMTLRQLGFAAVGALAVPALLSAQAQNQRPPEKGAAFILVTAFKSADRGPNNNIGAQAADALRSKISSEIPFKLVYVIPKERITPQLEASGFSTTEGLALHDMRALGGLLRADEYIAGTAVRTPAGGVRLTADLIETRDITFRQPLGTFEGPKMDVAMTALVKELKEALKQMEGETKCTNLARDKKFPEAIAAANAAITAYPRATLARNCLASVLSASGAKPAEILKVTQEITRIDPSNNPALKLQAAAYDSLKMTDSLVTTLTNLLRTDMNNAVLQNTVIQKIAESTNPGIARPIVDTAVVLNPGDPDLLKLRWLILSAVKDYKAMIAQGEELVKLDTSFADSAYYRRTSLAFIADSQPLKAAEAAARGLAKYPASQVLTALEIQQLQKAGQQQQALEKLDKALANKVAVEDAGAIRLSLLRDLKRDAEILPAIKAMIAAGDTTTTLRQNLFAQLQADARVPLAAATNLADSVTAFRKGLELMFYADSVIKTGAQVAETQFRVGGAQLQLGNALYQQAGAMFRVPATKAQACPVAKEAKDHITEAQILLPKGGSFNAQLTTQFMGYVMQLGPGIDSLLQQLKCS
ncbi:MAG: hypothetical protein ABJB66_20195 [Gemmatimonadaceae bacterium]